MSERGESGTTDTRRSSKVGRVLEEYEIEDLGETLEHRWTGDGEERSSLRDLADWLNKRLLEVAMRRANRRPHDEEINNIYRLLTDDSISSGVRTQTRSDLQRDGVALDSLENDFVSHQAIHTYLTKHRGATHTPTATSDEDRIESVIGAIQRLSQRTMRVAEDNLSTLKNTERLTIGEFDVLVDVTVTCQNCGRQYEIVDLLEAGSCECEPGAGKQTN